MSINSEMTALADAIRDKSGVTGKLSISGMTTAVSNISVGGGESGDIDLSGVTVTADKMLSGIVAVGADGNKVTGNIATVTPSVNKNTFTVGKGYVAEAFSQTIAEATVTETDSSVTITPGYVAEELNYDKGSGGDIDLSFITAGADQITLGYVGADQNGNPVYGTYDTGTSPDGIIQVASWHPQQPACTGLSQIVVSGLGSFVDEETGDVIADYSSANGTYRVTPETERVSNPFERIYKHSINEWYIWGYEEYEGEAYWHIGPTPDSGSLVCWTTGALTDDTFTFEDGDWGYSFEVTLSVTETSYEASGEYVAGVRDDNVFIECDGYEVTPQVGRLYTYKSYSSGSNRAYGRARDVGNGIYGDDLLLLTHWGVPEYQSRRSVDESGNGCEITRRDSTDLYIDTSQATSLFGNPILYFNYFDSDDGHIVIKKVPKAFEFTIEYWEYMYITPSNSNYVNWDGTVLVNKTCYDASGDWDGSTLISANSSVSNKISNQWFHHAFVWNGSLNSVVFEYINGVEVARHTFYGDRFYDEDTGRVAYKSDSKDYNYEHSIFGDDEYIFCPGGTVNQSSSRYVAQLAIWGRKIFSEEVANIVKYKQPYHL